MTLGEMIIEIAMKMGWRLTADLILVKDIIGNNEVSIDPLEAVGALRAMCSGCQKWVVPMHIENFLLSVEGTAVLWLMEDE